MVAIGFANVVGDDGIVTGSWSGRKLEVEAGGVYFVYFDALDFGKLFDAALNPDALGGFVAEAFNEVFGVLNHFLLVLIGAHLLIEALLPQDEIFGVVDGIVVDFAE